jgi:hypothetical protein
MLPLDRMTAEQFLQFALLATVQCVLRCDLLWKTLNRHVLNTEY